MSTKIPDDNECVITRNKAAIVVALKNLMMLGKNGDVNAVRAIVEYGLLCAEFLRNSSKMPQSSPERKCVEQAARLAMEWPIACPAIEDMRKASISEKVPSMLGENQPFRVNKKPKAKANRDFNPNSRTGFAFTYFQRVNEAYEWTRLYSTPAEFFTGELRKRGAFRIISALQPHCSKELWSSVIKAEETVGSVFKKNWMNSWDVISKLPVFCRSTSDAWVNAAMEIANADCGSNWATGPWPIMLQSAANRRRKREVYDKELAYKDRVSNWIKYGFKALAKLNDDDDKLSDQ